eukprot:m.83195 g.83195  ORF g.83195 m.83195 type:complete len:583 (+) comp12907_c0_seq1:108-1856(+)
MEKAAEPHQNLEEQTEQIVNTNKTPKKKKNKKKKGHGGLPSVSIHGAAEAVEFHRPSNADDLEKELQDTLGKDVPLDKIRILLLDNNYDVNMAASVHFQGGDVEAWSVNESKKKPHKQKQAEEESKHPSQSKAPAVIEKTSKNDTRLEKQPKKGQGNAKNKEGVKNQRNGHGAEVTIPKTPGKQNIPNDGKEKQKITENKPKPKTNDKHPKVSVKQKEAASFQAMGFQVSSSGMRTMDVEIDINKLMSGSVANTQNSASIPSGAANELMLLRSISDQMWAAAEAELRQTFASISTTLASRQQTLLAEIARARQMEQATLMQRMTASEHLASAAARKEPGASEELGALKHTATGDKSKYQQPRFVCQTVDVVKGILTLGEVNQVQPSVIQAAPQPKSVNSDAKGKRTNSPSKNNHNNNSSKSDTTKGKGNESMKKKQGGNDKPKGKQNTTSPKSESKLKKREETEGTQATPKKSEVVCSGMLGSVTGLGTPLKNGAGTPQKNGAGADKGKGKHKGTPNNNSKASKAKPQTPKQNSRPHIALQEISGATDKLKMPPSPEKPEPKPQRVRKPRTRVVQNPPASTA